VTEDHSSSRSQPVSTPESADFQWYWAAGEQPETYTGGPEKSRDAAMSAALREFEAGEVFTLISATKGSFWSAIPSAAEILDLAAEKASDDDMFGEDGFDDYVGGAAAVKAAEADLNAVLKAWFDRHQAIFPTPWTFGETSNEELITRPPYTAEEQAEIDAWNAQFAPADGDEVVQLGNSGMTSNPPLGKAPS
jgi:hypothetical protein